MNFGNRLYMIRVGRCNGNKMPSYKNFVNIVVLTKSSAYGEIGPYLLKNEYDQIFENVWQFSKVYEKVPKSTQRYSRYDSKIIWDHPAETHVKNGKLTPEYFKWREAGMNAIYPIRYPVGMQDRHTCLYSLVDPNEPDKQLNYIEARKEIYLKEYVALVKEQPKFKELQRMLKKGINLLIIEVDGPHQESLAYYQKKYGVDQSFIEQDTMLATPENLDIMLNDEKHAFGHGYCLAIALNSA